MVNGKDMLPPQGKENLMRSLHGAAREFLGELKEGPRADELNERTGYAFAADVDLDDLPPEQRHTMARDKFIKWLSLNDFRTAVTRVIHEAKDPEKIMQGYVGFTAVDGDTLVRAERAKALAAEKGFVVTEDMKVFEMNFDVPWQEENPENYIDMSIDGVGQTKEHFVFKFLFVGVYRVGSTIVLHIPKIYGIAERIFRVDL